MAKTAARLGIHHPRRLSGKAARARILAIWKRNPGVTAKQVVASLGLEHPLGIRRALKVLRGCRMVIAKRSSAQKQIRWRIDHRTVARVRVSVLWKQDPELTAEQVIAKLGLQHLVSIKWVRRILHDCWQASGGHSPEELWKGRRIYGNGGKRHN